MCQILHAKRDSEPDCEACIPALRPENEDAVRVFTICHGQRRQNGALDLLAVEAAMKRLGIEDKATFDKVWRLGVEFQPKPQTQEKRTR